LIRLAIVSKKRHDLGGVGVDAGVLGVWTSRWGVLVGFIAVYLLRSLSGLPQWLLDLEQFAHVLRLSGRSFNPAPPLWLLAIDDAAVLACGTGTVR
jgi:putative exporter of polyketide antibiotics